MFLDLSRFSLVSQDQASSRALFVSGYSTIAVKPVKGIMWEGRLLEFLEDLS
ncbi:hypothetical protein Syun_004609 [Stephania yunnanensis]|uniref:Uncharacterized protein n=1 Tax=Stephania yunnanensis TaxID=152371 RepID=A0AAP0L3D8_9MAGN